MNDTWDRTSSSLAIVERKPQRPGGCVGIFFQVFDWNRRFAKKKLFSKKLLPPVRLKQASKKFGGDEKQPKIHLIADENKGGFPTSKKNSRTYKVDPGQKHEMRAPSLVARLMGLEAMPAALQRDKSKKTSSGSFVFDKAEKCVYELNVEKEGINKHELRPQKLQKTSICERRPMTRFATDALPFKNVLPKSRKHHHPKLPSPVKSPRNVPKKSSSKLIGAATKILEPRLQTSRSKCAITYSNSLHHSKVNDVLEERKHLLPSQVRDSDDFASFTPMGQPSCRNCGHLLDTLDSLSSASEKPLIPTASTFSHCLGSSCQEYAYKSTSQQYKSQKEMLINEKKKFVPGNQRLIGSTTRSRVPSRMYNGKSELEKRIADRQNDSMTPGRKRRPACISRQGESSGFEGSTVKCHPCGFPHVMYGKELGYIVHSVSNQSNTNGLFHARERAVHSSKVDNNVGIREIVKKRVQNNLSGGNKALSENGTRAKFKKPCHLSGDALGAILEQKLKELNCQGEDLEGNAPRKTTATILQELISALTSEVPFEQDKLATTYDGESNICNQSHLSNSISSTSSQANAMAVKISVDQSLEREHLSPGSVLEAYFSNESCRSSSLDDIQGYKMLNESVDFSYSGQWSPNPDSELLDSANSKSSVKTSKELVINILDNVSKVLYDSSLADCGLNRSKIDRANEVLLNAELVFRNPAYSRKGFITKHLLLSELETVASVLWMNFGCALGIEDGKEVNQLKRFAFDTIVEYLELGLEIYPGVGSKVSAKFPLRTNMLIFDMVREVRKWEELSRFVHDELIEIEMGRSLGKWTKFEIEMFETGTEISRNVFQMVVDEIIMDFQS